MDKLYPEIFPSSIVPDRYSHGQFVVIKHIESERGIVVRRGIVVSPWKVGYELKNDEYLAKLVITKHRTECGCAFCHDFKTRLVFWR